MVVWFSTLHVYHTQNMGDMKLVLIYVYLGTWMTERSVVYNIIYTTLLSVIQVPRYMRRREGIVCILYKLFPPFFP